MGPSTKVSGRITKLMGKGLTGTHVVTFMRAIGKEIKLMEKENTPIQIAPIMTANGKMICNMVMELNILKKNLNTMGNITKDLNMDKEATNGPTAHLLPDPG